MKKLILVIALAVVSVYAFTQTITNQGAKVIVSNGTYLIFNSLHNSQAGGYFYYDTDLSVPGNWTNISPASFDQGSNGSVTLNGNTQQTVTSGGSSFGAIVVNNTSGSNAAIVLGDDLTVDNSLNLTNGIINTDGNKLVFQASASSNAGNANSFVDGGMQKTGAVPFVFPCGDVSLQDFDGNGNVVYKVWSPMTSNPVASTTVNVEYFFDDSGMPDWWEHGGNMDATLHHVSNREYWQVSSTEDFTNVTLYWNDNDHSSPSGICNHGFDYGDEADFVPADLSVAYWNGSMWVDADYNSDPALSNIVHDQGYITSRFSVPFGAKSQTFITLGSKNDIDPLPVELVSLIADCSGKQVDLIWQTASEINNSGFVIEKSDDAKTFSQIGFVAGAGNSNRTISYVFSDYKPSNGNNYYRLKQIDNDGRFAYSKVVSASCENDNDPVPSFIVYPNPSKDIINVTAENMPGETTVVNVYNVLGSLVYQKKETTVSGNAFASFDISSLPPAMYMVKIISGDYVGTKKVEKQ